MKQSFPFKFTNYSIYSLILLSILISCVSNTVLTDNWADGNYNQKIKKILVVGMAKEKWQAKAIENEIKNEMENSDVNVLVSWRTLPPDEKINKETFEKYFKDENIDAVLIVRSLGTTTDESIIEGGMTNVYVGYYGFYLSTHSLFFTPDYSSEVRTVHVDARMYETKEGKLIFKTTSQNFDPVNYSSTIKQISRAISSEIINSGLINLK